MAKKKLFSLITTISLALILLVTPCLIKVSGTSQNVRTTTVEVKRQAIDYQSILDEFENAELETEGSLTTFVGYKSINLADLGGFDLVSETDVEEDTEVSVKYNFSYDNETNIVTLSAELKDEFGEIQVDTLYGAAFINEYGEIDAVMNVDGEGILLSEMKDAGLIANCGWFSNLIKKVVKVVAVAVVAAVVVAATAAVVVATAGAAAPAVVAAGVGVVSTGVTTGAIAGTAIAAGATAAAVTAGIGVAVAIGETIAEETKTSTKNNDSEENNSKVKIPDYPGNDGSIAPGEDWEWRGNGEPGSNEGSWYNPKTGESLHPDLDHPDPYGPHWDYKAPNGNSYRLFPDGSYGAK